jgi:nitrate/nitrite transporter NarK
LDETGSQENLGSRNQLKSPMSGAVWLLALVYFGVNTCGYGVTLWLPKLIQSVSSLGHVAIGILSSIPYLLAAIVMVAVGIHSDRSGERRWHATSPALLAGGALVIATYSHSTAPMIAALSVAVLSLYSISGPFWALSTNRLDNTSAGAGIALINAIGGLGGFCGPYLLGLLSADTGNLKIGLLVLAGVITASGGLLLAATANQKTEPV